MIIKRNVYLKIFYGVLLGTVTCFYFSVFKKDITNNTLFIFGMAIGLFAGLSSSPFKIKKIACGIIGGFAGGAFLFLINLIPVVQQKSLLGFLILPVYGLFLSISIGFIDKSSTKIIAGIIGSFVASFFSFCLFIVATLLTVGFGWARPFPWLGNWPLYIAFTIIGAVMLVGIGIGECFKK